MDGDVERRPLISGGNEGPAATVEAAKFAESWLGGMFKVQAKQAGKQVYNLRANFRNRKKGFHVQVPKRMLFYTVLVFFIAPLVLFFYKENHIHDHDPAYHHVKKSHSEDKVAQHNLKETSDINDNVNNIHHRQPNRTIEHSNNNKLKHHGASHHTPLKQLLAGGMALSNNTTGSGTTTATASYSHTANAAPSQLQKNSENTLSLSSLPTIYLGESPVLSEKAENTTESTNMNENPPDENRSASAEKPDTLLVDGQAFQNQQLPPPQEGIAGDSAQLRSEGQSALVQQSALQQDHPLLEEDGIEPQGQGMTAESNLLQAGAVLDQQQEEVEENPTDVFFSNLNSGSPDPANEIDNAEDANG